MPEIIYKIIFILFLILANGIFAMSEIAVVSARNHILQKKAEEGNKDAKIALGMSRNPTRFLSTIQIGITLVGILSGAVAGATLASDLAVVFRNIPFLVAYSEELSLLIVVISITYLSLIFGELVPKRFGLANPEKIALYLARPMDLLGKITAPVINFLSASTEFILKIVGIKTEDRAAMMEEEIRIMLAQGTRTGLFNKTEREIVESVFRFGDRVVEEIMTPHTEIEWINLEHSLDEIHKQVFDSHHEQLPVAAGSLDNLLGILITKDYLVNLQTSGNYQITEMIKPPLFVPQNLPAISALEEIKKTETGILVVIDEHSGFLGLVTLMDILNAIVGDFPRNGLPEEQTFFRREDGSYLVDGLVPIDTFKDFFSIQDLPEEDEVGYLTLGGLVMSQFGEIPMPGNYFNWQNHRFEVVDMDGMRVDKVLITSLEKPLPLEKQLFNIE